MHSLYIGLGGSGISAVAEFAKKAKDKNLNHGNEFVYIDTDEYVLREHPSLREDFLLLSSNNSPGQVLRRAEMVVADPLAPTLEKKKYEQFLRWYERRMVCNESLNHGAEGIRILSRAMLFANYSSIKKSIAAKMIYRDPVDGMAKNRKIFVVSGTCGGTGSGIVIDILYMLQEIVIQLNYAVTESPVNLLLVMPQGYIEHLSSNSSLYAAYKMNAYALFDEINACLKDYYGFQGDDQPNAGMQWNKHRCCDNGEPPFQFSVFQNAFLFDSVDCLRRNPKSSEEIADDVSNFLVSMGLGSRGWQGLNNSVTKHIRAEKYNSAEAPFIKGFAATGTFVAQTWEELTRKYVHDKFVYQMLRYGFVGSEDPLPKEQLMQDVYEFRDRMDSIIHENDINSLIENVLDRSKFDELTRMIDFLKEVVAHNGKTPAIEEVMNDHGESRELAQAVIHLLTKVRETTYAMCSQWAMKYNLRHALQIVQHLDMVFDDQYKDRRRVMANFEPGRYFLKKTEKRREELHQMIQEYVKYLVCRNLSNEDDGYLDHTRRLLRGAICEVENMFFDYQINGIHEVEWGINFLKYLNGLRRDPTKTIYPNLDILINNDMGGLREGNEVERDYAALVHQEENSKRPDLSIDASNPFLLHTYKQKCIDAISQRYKDWACRFDLTSNTYVNNVKEAFHAFAKEVENEAVLLSTDDSLRKPFSNLTLSQAEQVDLVRRISAFDRVDFSVTCGMQNGPTMSIIYADFNNLPWLQHALTPAAAPNVQTIQSNNMPDRITKLHIGFGYSFYDYIYFWEYRSCFEVFFRRYRENPFAHLHQPFVDKRFLTDRKPEETLADMFAWEAAEGQQG